LSRIDADGATAALVAPPRAGVIDEDAAHRPCGDRDEVGAIPEGDVGVDQPDIRFVDERASLQSVVGTFGLQGTPRKAGELAVDDGQQPIERVAVAAAPRLQQHGCRAPFTRHQLILRPA
jgi:hypothetical protein